MADPDDARTRRVLDRYRSHPDPILREHAEWAAGRLGIAAATAATTIATTTTPTTTTTTPTT